MLKIKKVQQLGYDDIISRLEGSRFKIKRTRTENHRSATAHVGENYIRGYTQREIVLAVGWPIEYAIGEISQLLGEPSSVTWRKYNSSYALLTYNKLVPSDPPQLERTQLELWQY